ncbi:MAG: hypothetical protein ACW99G_09565 [Candidatus Thorarchaeota archaeon]
MLSRTAASSEKFVKHPPQMSLHGSLHLYLFALARIQLIQMGSVWFSKKSFLYFGGAAIILLGGAIVLMAPYHYVNFAVLENEQRDFGIWDTPGYYPQLEISVSMRPGNMSTIELDIVLVENVTLDTYTVNFTLTEDDLIETPDATFYEASMIVDIATGNYTVILDRVFGTTIVDLGLNQISDSRVFILVGGSMNILGAFMGIGGYFVAGSFLPSDSDVITEWGYDEEDDAFPQN